MKKLLLSVLLALSIAFTLLVFPTKAVEIVDSGDYKTFSWVLTSDGTVTISGEGTIGSGLKGRWASWKSIVKHVVIEPGIIGIGDSAFYNCSAIESIDLPDCITSIGNSAFFGCRGLTQLTIPEGVTRIGNAAFSGCSRLASATIPDGVSSIGKNVFYDCSSLTGVTISDSVTSIGENAFSGCSSLNNVTIPASVTSIGSSSFSRCSSLTSVTIPNSITSIEQSVFSGCSSLTSVTIPDGVTGIGQSAFSDCSNLTSVTIPDTVTIIGDSAFYGCSCLTSVLIPAFTSSIGNGAFSNCANLTEINVDVRNQNYRSIDGVLLNKSGTMLICYPIGKGGDYEVPEGVFQVSANAFSRCASLTRVTLPNSVLSIGDYAFYRCTKLTIVLIPDSVSSIGNAAFAGCSRLKNIYYSGNNNQWDEVSIKANNDPILNATIHFGASTPGKIESNPADATTAVGKTVSFSVTASGDIASYQWQYKTPAGSWKNCTAKTVGYNTDTLTVEATEVRNGYQYRCKVTDQDGNVVISDPATLTIAQPVVITASPADSFATAGRVSSFYAAAEGDGLTYQWQYKTPTGAWKNCSAATIGYNTQTLIVYGASNGVNRNGYQYRCVVTDAYGNTATTEAATLTVFAVKTQPKDAAVTGSGKATFKVAATGENLTYQWQYKTPTGAWKNCSSATQGYNTATLTVQGVSRKTNRNGYQYRCVVTSGSKTLTSNAATLTVN